MGSIVVDKNKDIHVQPIPSCGLKKIDAVVKRSGSMFFLSKGIIYSDAHCTRYAYGRGSNPSGIIQVAHAFNLITTAEKNKYLKYCEEDSKWREKRLFAETLIETAKKINITLTKAQIKKLDKLQERR